MDTYLTKIALKDSFDDLQFHQLVEQWLNGSKHYDMTVQPFDLQSEYQVQVVSEKYKLHRLSLQLKVDKVVAYRFENKEEKNIWYTDCIFVSNESEKSLTIKVSCEAKEFAVSLPRGHKPYIIKMLFDKNLCSEKGLFAITDTPILLTSGQIELCSDIMTGQLNTSLPVVYVSYDNNTPNNYAVDVNKLAQKLSGIAHVLVEPNKQFAQKLRLQCNDINAYNGFVGIYFPSTQYVEIVPNRENNVYVDSKKLQDIIYNKITSAAINHTYLSNWTWDSLLIEYHKVKYTQLESSSKDILSELKKTLSSSENKNEDLSKQVDDLKGELESKSEELDQYLDSFDRENKKLKEENEDLKKQIANITRQLEAFKQKNSHKNCIEISSGDLEEFYPGEIKDFIIKIFQMSQCRLKRDTRSHEILQALLDTNRYSGIGDEIANGIEQALKIKSIDGRRSALRACGFTVNEGSHDKIIFHDNNKYMFTLSNSPSDYRSPENTISDILKKISITKIS